MKAQQSFSIRTFIITILLNAAMLAAIYALAETAFQEGTLPLILGIGSVTTLVLWFAIQYLGRRLVDAAQLSAEAAAPSATGETSRSSAAPALQLLSILQRKGRLIDFLQEDLSAYDDARIGAAVRNVQEGCKQALAEYIRLAPVLEAEEGSEITLQPGFDIQSVRLTGNVVGDPPFRGTLRHRGWRVERFELPEQLHSQADSMILAAAEVEVTG